MPGWAVLVAAFVVMNALGVARLERESRRDQRERFAEDLKRLDDAVRGGDGLRIVEAEFRPGFFEGHGRARWESPDGLRVVEAEIDVPSRTAKERRGWPAA